MHFPKKGVFHSTLVGKPKYAGRTWACSSSAQASDLGMPMQSPIGAREGNVDWESRRHRTGAYVLFYHHGEVMRGERTCCGEHQLKAASRKASTHPSGSSPKYSRVRRCAPHVKIPVECIRSMGEGGKAGGTDTNELLLGLGQEVMFCLLLCRIKDRRRSISEVLVILNHSTLQKVTYVHTQANDTLKPRPYTTSLNHRRQCRQIQIGGR